MSRRSKLIGIALCLLVLFAFVAVVTLGPEYEATRDLIILFTALAVCGGLGLVASLEQRRRYISRIRNLDRSLRGEIRAITTELKNLSETVDRLREQGRLNEERQDQTEFRAMLRSSQLADHVSVPKEFFNREEATRLAHRLITEDPLRAHFLLSQSESFDELPVKSKRRLSVELRSRGYLEKSLEVLEGVVEEAGLESDRTVLRNRRSELNVLRGSYQPKLTAGTGNIMPSPGHILHVVGKALPKTQSGYTLRTHYTARAQLETGLRVSVVGQMGEAPPNAPSQEVIDGVTYHSVAGQDRTSQTHEEWLDANIAGVAEIVEEIKPSVLHAHSDFFNAITAQTVGAHFGIPVVYESRGFWEESWLSRISQKHAISDWEAVAARWGMPDAYTLRRSRETRARGHAGHVFTLAPVMKSYIEEQGLSGPRISLVPNAVNAGDFPVLSRDAELAEELNIPEHAVVVGYISSIVEYEGIDTLLEAFHSVRERSTHDLRLVIVGGGPFLANLKERNARLGGTDVMFTGKVSHENVLSYYSLIDIFVVPRKPSRVCQLVTPLKPFEAFSTGRTVIMSDVEALREIALESGAAGLFEAGNSESLTVRLQEFIDDEELRRRLAEAGAAWVRSVRTWSANADVYRRVYGELGALEMKSTQASWANGNRFRD